mmetsp:Transcript_7509/g.12513  ORF Transcript_7509/g.12513 Transcript_7509/m.12513 type:complete len:176 (+) Transcript_7509:108-635(+)
MWSSRNGRRKWTHLLGSMPVSTGAHFGAMCMSPKIGPPIPTAPYSPPITPPHSPTRAPNAERGYSVCGNGQQVRNPGELFTYAGQPAVLCGVVEEAGENGLILLDQCYSFLPQIITEDFVRGSVQSPLPTSTIQGAPVAEPSLVIVAPITRAPASNSPTRRKRTKCWWKDTTANV